MQLSRKPYREYTKNPGSVQATLRVVGLSLALLASPGLPIDKGPISCRQPLSLIMYSSALYGRLGDKGWQVEIGPLSNVMHFLAPPALVRRYIAIFVELI